MAEPGVSSITTSALASTAANEEVEGLADLFNAARIEGYIPAAVGILCEWGAVDIAEVIGDADLVSKLEEELQLKLLEKRRLHAAIKERLSPLPSNGPGAAAAASAADHRPPPGILTAPGSVASASAAAANRSTGFALDPAYAEGYVVRNTFLDTPQPPDLQRTSTAPPQFHAALLRQASAAEDACASGDEASLAKAAPGLSLDRTTTHDVFSYEKTDPRTWLQGPGSAVGPPPPPPYPFWPPPMPYPWYNPQMYGDLGDSSYGGFGAADAVGSMISNDAPSRGSNGAPSNAASWNASGQVPERSSEGRKNNAAVDIPVIQRTVINDGKTTRVCWAVPERKLRSSDTSIVSPRFECVLSAELPAVLFKLIIYAKATSEGRDGASFNTSKGRGSVKLVLADSLPENAPKVSFFLSIGTDGDLRGPMVHDFSQQKVCGLSEEDEEWNFKAAIDSGTKVFMVNVEISAAVVTE
mmetsp:Transcript_68807/g.165158  ORF Transcript_68807/g.165158 Transcript_68807/m.165158 type:complete len:470 (+) Transcript_68807:68-1477(+)